jgi:hypothetical protein
MINRIKSIRSALYARFLLYCFFCLIGRSVYKYIAADAMPVRAISSSIRYGRACMAVILLSASTCASDCKIGRARRELEPIPTELLTRNLTSPWADTMPDWIFAWMAVLFTADSNYSQRQ